MIPKINSTSSIMWQTKAVQWTKTPLFSPNRSLIWLMEWNSKLKILFNQRKQLQLNTVKRALESSQMFKVRLIYNHLATIKYQQLLTKFKRQVWPLKILLKHPTRRRSRMLDRGFQISRYAWKRTWTKRVLE
jgi:hypothetical protein